MNIAVIISSFLSAVLGAMGVGGGTVLIIYLTTFLAMEQKSAQGINLLFFLLTGILAVISNIKKELVDKKALKELIIISLPGLIAGFVLLNFISATLLKKLFGVILLSIGIKTLFNRNKSAPAE